MASVVRILELFEECGFEFIGGNLAQPVCVVDSHEKIKMNDNILQLVLILLYLCCLPHLIFFSFIHFHFHLSIYRGRFTCVMCLLKFYIFVFFLSLFFSFALYLGMHIELLAK